MTLFIKAAADGKSTGDCPFAHFVRMVLEEKGLEYELRPSAQVTKPPWLLEHYDGKMPALRHRKECYIESDVIAEYLDFFFPIPSLKVEKSAMEEAEQVVAGIFPAVANYLKHTPDGDDVDTELKSEVVSILCRLESHLAKDSRTGPFLVGKGENITLLDCSLAPKLYHMQTGIELFKDCSIVFDKEFPALAAYCDAVFTRDTFRKTMYGKDVVAWGWSNARS
jgi:glutathione S-transferase